MRLAIVITDLRHTRWWLSEEVLSAIARKHELEILIDSRISEEVLLPSRLAGLIEKTVFNYQEPAWLLNLFHLIWIDARRTNVSFRTKYIREFIGDVKIWQPTLSLRSRVLHALGRIWEVSFRFLKPKFLLTFFPPTRKLGIWFLANRLSKFDISQLPDFSRHSLVIFPSIGYEPGSWLLFERIRAQGSRSLVAIDNWDNVSSKSIYIRKPSFISVPGPKSAETARELHGFSNEQILEWGMPKFDILRSQLKSSDSLRRLLYVGYSQPHDELRSLETVLRVASEKDVEVSYRPHPLRKHTRFTEESSLDSRIQIRGKSGSEMRSTGGHPPLDSSYAADLEWADLVVGPPTTLLLEALFVGKPIVVDATLDSHHRSSGFYAFHGYKHMQELLTVHGIRIAEDYIQLEKHVSDATNSLADFPRGQESVRDILARDKSYLSSFLSFIENLNHP